MGLFGVAYAWVHAYFWVVHLKMVQLPRKSALPFVKFLGFVLCCYADMQEREGEREGGGRGGERGAPKGKFEVSCGLKGMTYRIHIGGCCFVHEKYLETRSVVKPEPWSLHDLYQNGNV
jgi:hypothetical protein